MTKGTQDALAALHGMVAEVLTKGLEGMTKPVIDGVTGEEIPPVYDARIMAQALSFLKDNDITVDDEGATASEIQEELDRIKGVKRVTHDPFADIPYEQ